MFAPPAPAVERRSGTNVDAFSLDTPSASYTRMGAGRTPSAVAMTTVRTQTITGWTFHFPSPASQSPAAVLERVHRSGSVIGYRRRLCRSIRRCCSALLPALPTHLAQGRCFYSLSVKDNATSRRCAPRWTAAVLSASGVSPPM